VKTRIKEERGGEVKFKKTGFLMKVVIAALIIYGVINISSIRSQISQAERELLELRQKEQRLLQENAELEYDIAHAGDDETIMDIARAKLGLVMPGEIIFFDIGN